MEQKTKRIQLQKLTLSAMFLALGLVLPFFTGQIPQIGSMLLPMHIPVLVCGMICGSYYGGIIGFILPIMRYFLFGMPPIFPTGLAMAFELAVYGFIAGKMYYESKWKCWTNLYFSLLTAMIGGRAVWGVVFGVLCGLSGQEFTMGIFISSAIVNAIPGIVLQLMLVPVLVKSLNKTLLITDMQVVEVK